MHVTGCLGHNINILHNTTYNTTDINNNVGMVVNKYEILYQTKNVSESCRCFHNLVPEFKGSLGRNQSMTGVKLLID